MTTYYDLLRIVDDVRAAGTAHPAGTEEAVVAAARRLDANLAAARALQARHGCVYPSLGAVLGATDEAFHALSFHHAEEALPAEQHHRYPHLRELAARCPCGECDGEVARVHCHLLVGVTGLDWRQFRSRYEVLVPGERYDVVLGDNITMLHGGWAGGRSRLIEPLCMVVDDPVGEAYESWLAQAWRRPRT